MYESSKKILVIEDDTVTRNFLLNGIEAEGFDVIGAENSFVGIQQAQEHLPDLVICNILMPDMDGYSVLAKLREDPVTVIIPLIFLSDSTTKTDFRKAMEFGADDYITKPFTLDELLRAIATRLQKQAALQYQCAIQSYKAPESVPEGKTLALAPKSIFPNIPKLKEVFDFIEANYYKGITLCDVAQAVGYSPAYLTNRVARLTGETVNNWIVKRRMAEARFVLQNQNQTVEQIAKLLGYEDVSYFSRQFRQHHDLPPNAWRKEHQNLYSNCEMTAAIR